MSDESAHENKDLRHSGRNKFIQQIDESIEKNLENERFGVAELAVEMNLSRMQVYRKVLKITGKNVSQYIREKRLNFALKMLREEELTVSEIAYKVGFGSVSYFSNCFRKHYGFTPGQAKAMSDNAEPANTLSAAANQDEAVIILDEKKTGRKRSILAGLLIILLLVSIGYLAYRSISGIKSSEKDTANNPEREKTLAVLPFTNDSPDKQNEYFCNGMMEDVLSNLERISDLRVKARRDVEQYRNSIQNITSIADELGVSYILLGAARKENNRFMITMRLLDGESGNQIWAENYDGVFTDTIWAVQSDIARKIASSLSIAIKPEEAEDINKLPTHDIAAYDLRMKAGFENSEYWRTLDKTHLSVAHKLLDIVLKIDPEYVEAIALKGGIYLGEGKYDSGLYYADRAIQYDPKHSQTYGLKAEIYTHMGESDLALEYFQKAININPREDGPDLWWHVAIGAIYTKKGNYKKALPYLKYKLDDDAIRTVHLQYHHLFMYYLNIGDYQLADKYSRLGINSKVFCWDVLYISRFLRVKEKFSESQQFVDSLCMYVECKRWCLLSKFESYLYLAEFELAEKYFDTLNYFGTWHMHNRDFMNDIVYQIGYVYDKLGKTEQAHKTFTEQINIIESSFGVNEYHDKISQLNLSRIYAYLGDRKKAIEHLSAYAKNGFQEGWHDFILIDPFFENLRSDPEFLAIVRKAQEEITAIREEISEMEANGELIF
jgi:TolB-like protein/AraC-like DNA-binding protein